MFRPSNSKLIVAAGVFVLVAAAASPVFAQGVLFVADGKVGVGIDTPTSPLHVVGDNSGTIRVERTDGGTPNIRFATSGGAATQQWVFQNNATSGDFGIRDATNANTVINLKAGAPQNGLRVNADGSWSTSTGASLTTGGKWQDASSRALKRNIETLSLGSAEATLAGLVPVTFEYKRAPGESHVGFIAEDVPELVAAQDHKGLSAMDIVAVLTRVVQSQQSQLEAQAELIETLGRRLETLEGE